MTSRKRDKITGIGDCHIRFYVEQNKAKNKIQQWNQIHHNVAFYAYTLKTNNCQLNAMIKVAKFLKVFLA